ncbi:J domain-containing protein [Candidatus Dependentiae bacterium]|nr:J domain-containing protein [Candidatus Dependentiae bacterium]
MIKSLRFASIFLTALTGGVVSKSYTMQMPQEEKSKEESKIYIKNDTAGRFAYGWNIQVNAVDKKGVNKPPYRLSPGERRFIGKANDLESISYHSYGDKWEKASKEWPVEFKSKLKPGFDTVIVITTWLELWSESVEYVPSGTILEEDKFKELNKEIDPWSFFGTAKDYKDTEKIKAYRLVMGLKPNFTKEQLQGAFKQLALEYHPDKVKNVQLSTEIMKLLNNANLALKKDLEKK